MVSKFQFVCASQLLYPKHACMNERQNDSESVSVKAMTVKINC